MRPPLQELAMVAKLSSSFLRLSHFSLEEVAEEWALLLLPPTPPQSTDGAGRSQRRSYSSLRLILVNSTRPASMGSVSSPAEIIRRQSSYVWSVTGTPRALEAHGMEKWVKLVVGIVSVWITHTVLCECRLYFTYLNTFIYLFWKIFSGAVFHGNSNLKQAEMKRSQIKEPQPSNSLMQF